jgi:hypothetical protein
MEASWNPSARGPKTARNAGVIPSSVIVMMVPGHAVVQARTASTETSAGSISFFMRADALSLHEQITASVALLRRHL